MLVPKRRGDLGWFVSTNLREPPPPSEKWPVGIRFWEKQYLAGQDSVPLSPVRRGPERLTANLQLRLPVAFGRLQLLPQPRHMLIGTPQFLLLLLQFSTATSRPAGLRGANFADLLLLFREKLSQEAHIAQRFVPFTLDLRQTGGVHGVCRCSAAVVVLVGLGAERGVLMFQLL